MLEVFAASYIFFFNEASFYLVLYTFGFLVLRFCGHMEIPILSKFTTYFSSVCNKRNKMSSQYSHSTTYRETNHKTNSDEFLKQKPYRIDRTWYQARSSRSSEARFTQSVRTRSVHQAAT